MKIKKVCAIFIIIYFYFIQYIFIKLKVWLTGISCFYGLYKYPLNLNCLHHQINITKGQFKAPKFLSILLDGELLPLITFELKVLHGLAKKIKFKSPLLKCKQKLPLYVHRSHLLI